jgi:hypothetical protein
MAGGWQNQEVVLSDKPHLALYFTTRKIGVIFHRPRTHWNNAKVRLYRVRETLTDRKICAPVMHWENISAPKIRKNPRRENEN